jgi:hypothetical protein
MVVIPTPRLLPLEAVDRVADWAAVRSAPLILPRLLFALAISILPCEGRPITRLFYDDAAIRHHLAARSLAHRADD